MCQTCLQDFHTAIAGAMSDEEYMRELYSAMLEDAQQDLVAGMERAAQRCVKKAELKVQSSLRMGASDGLVDPVMGDYSDQRPRTFQALRPSKMQQSICQA